jgi:hypothetical protein
MAESQVKTGEWIAKGIQLYKKHLLMLFTACFLAGLVPLVVVLLAAMSLPSIVGTIVVQIIGVVLAAPLYVGVFRVVFELLDRPEESIQPLPQSGDILKSLDKLKPAAMFMGFWALVVIVGNAILGLLPGLIGFPLSLIYNVSIATLTLFGLPLITSREIEFWPASRLSIDTVAPDIVQFAVFSLVLGIISLLGGILFGIGVFITLPIYPCAIAIAYKDIFSEK